MASQANPLRRSIAEPGFGEFVAMIAAMMAMTALSIDSMLPALPAIGESLGIVDANARQWVIAAFLLGFGTGQIVHGPLSDRYGRRSMVLISLLAVAICNVLAAIAGSFELLLAARVASGLAVAACRVLAVSIVRDRFSGRQMARVMSLAFIVFMAAPVLAPTTGQLILLFANWRWIFAVLAIAALALLAWTARRLPETLAEENRLPLSIARVAAGWRTTLGDRLSLGYTSAMGLLSGALFGFINSIQQIFADIFHAPQLMTILFACIAGTMALASLINSRIVIRFGTRKISHAALIGFIAVAAIHLAVALSGHETIITFSILQALMMGCFGLAGSNFGAMAMENMGGLAGTASSVQGFYSTILGAVIGIVIGQAFDGSTVPLYTGFVLCGLAALSVVFVTEHGRLFRPHHQG